MVATALVSLPGRRRHAPSVKPLVPLSTLINTHSRSHCDSSVLPAYEATASEPSTARMTTVSVRGGASPTGGVSSNSIPDFNYRKALLREARTKHGDKGGLT